MLIFAEESEMMAFGFHLFTKGTWIQKPLHNLWSDIGVGIFEK
jgi:hypothetical protein